VYIINDTKEKLFLKINTVTVLHQQTFTSLQYKITDIAVENKRAHVNVMNFYWTMKMSLILLLMKVEFKATFKFGMRNITNNIQFNHLFLNIGKFK
jgi:hypothetical protein